MHKLLFLVAVTLTGCAGTASKNENSDAQKIVELAQKLVGRNESGCYIGSQKISMTKKNVWEYSEKYNEKLTNKNLIVNEVACDLGRPHVITPVQFETTLYGLPTKPGDKLYQWGSQDTNNPRDEVSILLVGKENGIVTGLVRYLPKDRTVKTIIQGPEKIKVTNGTYTATVTRQ